MCRLPRMRGGLSEPGDYRPGRKGLYPTRSLPDLWLLCRCLSAVCDPHSLEERELGKEDRPFGANRCNEGKTTISGLHVVVFILQRSAVFTLLKLLDKIIHVSIADPLGHLIDGQISPQK